MEFDFMNDGAVTSPQKTEPTTGNEIPPGSSSEEVADTVDAKLSVGEYVVPADVVQYFGVAYFEKLRQKAKESMAKMDLEGQVNGGASDDELPFSDEELATEEVSEEPQAFAEGGVVQQNPTGTESRTYVGPTGQEIQIMFVNGVPTQQIPHGFVLKVEAPTGSKRSLDVKDSEPKQQNTLEEPKDMSEWTIEDFEKFSNQQGITQFLSGAANLLGPGGALIGKIAQAGYSQSAQKALQEVNNRLSAGGLDDQTRQRLETLKSSLEESSESKGLFGRMGDSMRSGNGLLGGLIPEGGLLGQLFKPRERALSPTASATTGRNTSSGGNPVSRPTTTRSTSPTPSAPTSSPRPEPRSVGTASRGESNPGGFDKDKGSFSVGPMAKGGLIKRR